MSDIENAKPKRRKKNKIASGVDAGAPAVPASGQSANEMDGELGRDPAAESDASPGTTIEWNKSTSGLDFRESTPLSEQEPDDTLARFEELARRVADTVSRNRGAAEAAEEITNADPMEGAEAGEASIIAASDISTVEATESSDALGGVGVEATELELNEIQDTEVEGAELQMAEITSELNEGVTALEPLDTVAEEFSAEASAGASSGATATSLGAPSAIGEAGLEPSTEARPETFADGAAPEMAQMNISALENELSQAENDADPEPVEFVEHDRLMSIIESLLFSTDKPVSTATIKQVFKGSNVRSKDITHAIDLLASEYASLQRGVTLEEINGGYQLRTKPDNTEFLRRLAKVRPFRLSGPALEVMAIVAYKQPVTKGEIDQIRGVESGHLLRALMERGLVSFGDKSELPGKPMTYQSTRKFLETFGLRNIRELPSLGEIDELLPEGIGEVEEEKETLSDLTDQMSTTIGSTYSEGEDELTKINEQLQAVDTTSEFFEQEKVREREKRDRERAQDIREKLVLDDAVDEKDRRWLDRYEAKLHAPAVAPPETSAIDTASPDGALADGIAPGATAPIDRQAAAAESTGIGADLEALTEESRQAGAVAAEPSEVTAKGAGAADDDMHVAESEESVADLEAELDDLTGNMDWDEDSEKEI